MIIGKLETDIKVVKDDPLYQSSDVVEGSDEGDTDYGEWVTVQGKLECMTYCLFFCISSLNCIFSFNYDYKTRILRLTNSPQITKSSKFTATTLPKI